jgi:5S rRNA maturation endonuclease (ribonuclease M5)
LRPDKHPSCNLQINNSGVVKFLDYSDIDCKKTFGIDLFKVLNILYGYDYSKSCELIYKYIQGKTIFLSDNSPKIKKSFIAFDYYIKNGNPAYTKECKDYYKSYGISIKNLVLDEVYFLKTLYYRNTILYPKELAIGFDLQNERKKIYFPFGENKWYSNTTSGNYWLIKGSNDLIITTSHKDARVAHNLTNKTVFAPMSESSHINISIIEMLKQYDNILVLGDGDRAGQEFNQRMINTFNCKSIDITNYSDIDNDYGKKCKDISEIYRLDKQLAFDILNE